MKKTVKVILLKEVPGLGRTGDVKEVPLGFAHNHLLPKGVVEIATPEMEVQIAARLEKDAKEAEAGLESAESAANKLDGQSFDMKAGGSNEGKLYASVTPAAISKVLKKNGFEISAQKIVIKSGQPIKESGEHEVTINLEHGLEANIIINIEVEEK
ncbi:50S ribosomal protein L9 [bacterium]|nr:50S ribosomal protein L9 [bacterium]|tara:strand:- start:540 stop:1007 length:468 start_codon:yes stop_codon:yes gene_type:complete